MGANRVDLGNGRVGVLLYLVLTARAAPKGRGGLSQSQSLCLLSTDINIKRPQHPPDSGADCFFSQILTAPPKGDLLCASFFTQRNASSPVDTTHVYEDPFDAPSASSKALLARLVGFVFSHRRPARPRVHHHLRVIRYSDTRWPSPKGEVTIFCFLSPKES